MTIKCIDKQKVKYYITKEKDTTMEKQIIDFITHYGYIAVFLLILIENIFPPIPSEVVLTFSGAMCLQTSLSVIGVIAVSTLGSYFGALILYGVGRLLSYEKLERLCQKSWVRRLGFKYRDIEKAKTWFDRHGVRTVFLCRLVPMIRSLISIPAGIVKMPFINFSLWTLIGTLIWNSVLVYVGKTLGEHWQNISVYIRDYAIIIAIFFVIAFIVKRIYKKRTNVLP